MIKVMKYQIIKPVDTDWDVLGKVLRDLQYETRQAMNRTIQLCWWWNSFCLDYKQKNGVYPKAADHLGSSLGGYIYRQISRDCPKQQTGNLSIAQQSAMKRYDDSKIGMLKGEMSVPSYRSNNPIYLHKNSIKISFEDGHYCAVLSLLSIKYKQELGLNKGTFTLLINEGDNSSKTILNRCISGEFGISSSMILHDAKRKKWYFCLCYDFSSCVAKIESNKVLGVDMGIVYPIYMAVYGDFIRGKIDGGEIDHFRKGIERRKNELLRQGKYCGDGRIGHGVKTRIRPTEFAEKRIANFRDTCNHKYSRFVVDFAVRNHCGIIQMEDLKGINEDNVFLKNWTYFDLQTKIEYKAKEYGIKVIKINPQYTSQRCSKCGFIHKENRPEQKVFKCLKCGFETNADYNASLNIATPNIDKIIETELQCES